MPALVAEQNEFTIKLKELEDNLLYMLANAEGDILGDEQLIISLEETKATSQEIAEKVEVAKETEVTIAKAREIYRPIAERGALMFFLLGELNKLHTFHHYSLNSFIIVFQTAVTGKRQRVTWNSTGNALLDMILPKKRKGLFGKINLKKVIASNQSPEELQKRLDFLTENITYQVFNFGMFECSVIVFSVLVEIIVHGNS